MKRLLLFLILIFSLSCSDGEDFPIIYNYDGIVFEESYTHVYSENNQRFEEIDINPYLERANNDLIMEMEEGYRDIGLLDRVEIIDSSTVKYSLIQDNIRLDTTITLDNGDAVRFFEIIGANAVIEEVNNQLLWCKFVNIYADYENLFGRYFSISECVSSDIDVILNDEINNYSYSDKDTLCSFLPRLVYTKE